MLLVLILLSIGDFFKLQQGDPIEERVKEHAERGTVIDQLAYCVNSYREAAASNDAKFEHIDLADKQKVMDSTSPCPSLHHFN